jgi:type II secretion system protein C
MGVIISENMSNSLAILKDEKTGKIRIVRVGDNIFGLTVTRILENRIILQKGELTLQLLAGRGSLTMPTAEGHMNSISLSTTHYQEENLIKFPKSNNIIKKEFARSEVEKRILKEWQSIIREVKYVPNYVNGEIRGFKIIALPEKSFISEVGIQKDDIIREINGIELNDWPTLFDMYNKLKNENQFKLSIERDGQITRILYILK